MNRVVFVLRTLLLIALCASFAQAESSKNRRILKNKPSRFSQLGFDAPAHEDKKRELLNRILAEEEREEPRSSSPSPAQYSRASMADAAQPAEITQDTQKPAVGGKTAGSAKSVAVVFAELSAPYSDYGLLAPQLPQPDTDSENPLLIAGNIKWLRQDGETCAEPKNAHSLQRKAQALAQVVLRFTGSEDFYQSLTDGICAGRCGTSLNAVVTGFAVESSRGGSFTIKEDNGSCHYEVQKPNAGNWVTLQGTKVVCSCLP
ncbi:MAG TPA: hypothetical protein PLP17_08615 [Oligoflexia bacterium]|nr:hypothetical protein [Oligoflexia bacterium]